jgi:hypothetical protein
MQESDILTALQAMETDKSLITKSAYRANAELWPKNRISFVDSHLTYLKSHPAVNPSHYLSNLKLMLRKKP